MHDGWGDGWMMLVGMTVFWGLVIFGIVWLIRGTRPDHSTHRSKTANEILDERLARGEITIDEHAQRSAAITSKDKATD